MKFFKVPGTWNSFKYFLLPEYCFKPFLEYKTIISHELVTKKISSYIGDIGSPSCPLHLSLSLYLCSLTVSFPITQLHSHSKINKSMH